MAETYRAICDEEQAEGAAMSMSDYTKIFVGLMIIGGLFYIFIHGLP